MDGALAEARAATGALLVVELVAQTHAELHHRVLGAGAEAAVALEAVAARQAPSGLERRLVGGEPRDHLVEGEHPTRGVQLGLAAAIVVPEVPQVEQVEAGERVLVTGGAHLPAEPGVDRTGRALAVAHPDRDRPLARDGVPAGEDARSAGHQRGRRHLHRLVDDLDARDGAEERGVALLTEGQDQGVGGQGLEPPGPVRPPVLVELLHLDRQVALAHRGDRAEPVDPDALVLGVRGLLLVGGHLVPGTSVDDEGVVRAEAASHASCVHGGVAAAVHRDAATQRLLLAGGRVAQEAHRVEHPARVLVRDVDPLGQVSAHGDEDGIEATGPPLLLQVDHAVSLLEAHAEVGDALHLGVEHVPGQPVGRDPVAHHPAGQLAAVADRDVVPEAREVVRRGQAARAGTHHQHPLARGWRGRGEHPAVLDREVAEVALDPVDRHGLVELGAVADALAGVVADPPVDRGQRVVVGQLAPGFLGTACLDEREPGLDVLTGRTARVAGRQQVDVHRSLRAHRPGAQPALAERRGRSEVAIRSWHGGGSSLGCLPRCRIRPARRRAEGPLRARPESRPRPVPEGY